MRNKVDFGKEKKDSCACCGSSKYELITDKLRHNKAGTVVKCTKCDLVRLLGIEGFKDKASAFYQEQYAKEYHKGIKADLDGRFDTFLSVQPDRINVMKKYFRRPDNLLEIGSSVGYFLHLVKKYVKNVYGIELNIQEARYANEVKGVNTSSKPLEDSEFSSIEFDHICLFQLLEHIPDPILFLRNLKKYLKDGGYVHIEVPNIMDPLVNLFDIVEYRNFFYQEPHLYYFSQKSLKNIAEKAGLKIVSLTPFQQTSITNSLNWIYSRSPQLSRRDCIQVSLPASHLASRNSEKAKKEIDVFMNKLDKDYKKVLLKNGFADNIFCTLKFLRRE